MPVRRSARTPRTSGSRSLIPAPMLATLADLRHFPSDPALRDKWIFEQKLDGFRALACRQGDQVQLLSRTHQDFAPRYPEIVEGLRNQPIEHFIIDGEIVAFEGSRVSFQQLQQRGKPITLEMARRSLVRVAYFAFDLLQMNGIDARPLPLRQRKQALKKMLESDRVIRFTPHRTGSARELLADACNKGWEGLIAKNAESTYIGARTRDWLKLKCNRRQEFVVGGYTDPQGSRNVLGALLVGYYDTQKSLQYAGKVGTGFSERTLRELSELLRSLPASESPFAPDPALPRRGVHWLKPKLVAEVEFFEWTSDGKLRHPKFMGLRPDKSPTDVVREEP